MSSPTTLAIINQKGGVGKTTTVINLAASLSIMGQNNLVVDLDPQGNATTGLGKNNNDEDKNVYNLLIKKTNIADNGEIVVALIDDNEATLKRIRKKGQSIALESANPIYETRILSAHRVKIQGKLIGLLRKY